MAKKSKKADKGGKRPRAKLVPEKVVPATPAVRKEIDMLERKILEGSTAITMAEKVEGEMKTLRTRLQNLRHYDEERLHHLRKKHGIPLVIIRSKEP